MEWVWGSLWYEPITGWLVNVDPSDTDHIVKGDN